MSPKDHLKKLKDRASELIEDTITDIKRKTRAGDLNTISPQDAASIISQDSCEFNLVKAKETLSKAHRILNRRRKK